MKTSRRHFLKTTGLAIGVGLVFTNRAFAVRKKSKIIFNSIVSPTSTVTCPTCKTKTTLQIPGEVPLRVFHCPVCLTWLAPKKGDHCIFDSYGSVHCEEIQVKLRRQQKLLIPTDATAVV